MCYYLKLFTNKISKSLLAFALITASATDAHPSTSPFPIRNVALIGDSATTGAVAHPDLGLDPVLLLGRLNVGFIKAFIWQLTGKTPIRDFLPSRKHFGNPDAFNLNSFEPPVRLSWTRSRYEMYGTQIRDTEVYSWGYLLARKLGVEPKQIIMTARDGQRSSSLARQVQRLLKYTQSFLPSLTFVQFTGNDICSESIFEESDQNTYQRIYSNYREGIDALLETSTPSEDVKHVYLMPFMDIVQVLDNEDVLNTRTRVGPVPVTCRDLASKFTSDPRVGLVADRVGLAMAHLREQMCDSVLRTTPDDASRIEALRHKQDIIRQAQEDIAVYANELFSQRPVKFHFLNEVIQFRLGIGDVANECFHLGLGANENLALMVHDAIISRGFEM